MDVEIIQTESHRYSGVEFFRFIASFGIVWFHCQTPGANIGYGGLPFFIMISVFFVSQNMNKHSSSIKSKFIRIMIPWIFWSIVYVIARLLLNLVTGAGLFNDFKGWMILTGGSLHLWYLPYLFLTLLIINSQFFKHISAKFNDLILLSLSLFIFLTVIFFFDKMSYKIPLIQYVFLFPAISIGFYIGRSVHLDSDNKFYYKGLFLFIIISVIIGYFFSTSLTLPYGVALLLFCAAIKYRNSFKKSGEYFGMLSFGIYLIHPIFISLVSRIIHTPNLYILAALTFIFSAISVIVLKQTLFSRFV